MTNLQLLTQVLKCLPAYCRDDYMSDAYIKLRHMRRLGVDEGTIIRKLRNYLHRENRARYHPAQAMAPLAFPVPSTDAGAGMVEVRDATRRLANRDRAILALLVAGHTHNQIARQRGCGNSTVTRAVKRLRAWYDHTFRG